MDDTVPLVDTAITSRTTLQNIYDLFVPPLTTLFGGLYAKYLWDADFYKYSINRYLVNGSGVVDEIPANNINLKVELLNYLGATPSATAPVKIQNQDWTIRTITSSCSATIASNDYYHFNAGSTELATKEIDYCVYIGKFGWPLISRLYHYRKISDGNLWWESAISNTGWFSGTDTFVPIWRFNAIKASWTSGNWSIPATSIIINSPIYFSLPKDWTPTINAGTSTGITNVFSKYNFDWKKIHCEWQINISTPQTTINTITVTLPFTSINQIAFSTYLIDNSVDVSSTWFVNFWYLYFSKIWNFTWFLVIRYSADYYI